MSLPILKTSSTPTTETLIRYFHQGESNWTEHLAARTLLDVGTAWTSAEFDRVDLANRMLDVALPSEISPQQAFDQVAEHFAAQNLTCLKWTMNPSAPKDQTAPMEKFLLEKNYRREVTDIMYLERISLPKISASIENLKIIPARSSFRHARAIFQEKDANVPQFVEAEMLHLDDPHYDALLALKDGNALAITGVLSTGESGFIKELFISESSRRQGLATIMLSRALEICARSLFKHIMLAVPLDNEIAINLHKKFGFKKIGELIEYKIPVP
jgi:GNAT superfamily N-acetyltransferase